VNEYEFGEVLGNESGKVVKRKDLTME